jgi:hypothetical protein
VTLGRVRSTVGTIRVAAEPARRRVTATPTSPAIWPVPPVTLEDLIPPDHFYRHLESTLDLGSVRDLVRDAYAEAGRPSIDPVVFFKLQLIMFFEGIRSERHLIETASLNLAHRLTRATTVCAFAALCRSADSGR